MEQDGQRLTLLIHKDSIIVLKSKCCKAYMSLYQGTIKVLIKPKKDLEETMKPLSKEASGLVWKMVADTLQMKIAGPSHAVSLMTKTSSEGSLAVELSEAMN
jgi:hypothetical protein